MCVCFGWLLVVVCCVMEITSFPPNPSPLMSTLTKHKQTHKHFHITQLKELTAELGKRAEALRREQARRLEEEARR